MTEKLDLLTGAYLASAMQKLLLNEEAYVSIGDGSACIDGWVWNLSDDEAMAMRSVRGECNDD